MSIIEEVTNQDLLDDGYDEQFADDYAGFYYRCNGDTISGHEDIFRESWDSVTGPTRDDVCGPFGSHAAAVADMERE